MQPAGLEPDATSQPAIWPNKRAAASCSLAPSLARKLQCTSIAETSQPVQGAANATGLSEPAEAASPSTPEPGRSSATQSESTSEDKGTGVDTDTDTSENAESKSADAGGSDSEQQRELALAGYLYRLGKHGAVLGILNQSKAHVSPATYCLKGKCLAALGDNGGAFASFMGALAQQPHHVEALLACAELHKACGCLTDAAASLRLALEADTDNALVCEKLAVVLTDIGISLQACQDASGARAQYEEATHICPGYAAAQYNMGVLQISQGQIEEAMTSYAKAIELAPQYAEAHCNIGVIHKQGGRLDEALVAYERAFTIAPCSEIIRANLAIVLTDKGVQCKAAGDTDAALQLYERALALRPQHAEALYNMGVACHDAGHVERASFFYETALAHAPRCAEAWNNLGVVQRQMRNMERAAHCYAAALQLRPSFLEALNNMAVIYTSQGRSHDAMQLLRAALLSAPEYAEAWNTLGVLQRDLGQMQDAITAYERCMQLAPGSRNAFQNRLLALNSILPGEAQCVSEAHAEWGRSYQERLRAAHPSAGRGDFTHLDRTADRPLIVGYVSADFFTHSVSYFAEAPLSHHSPARVKQIVYNCVPQPDARTARLRNAVTAVGGIWRDVEAVDEPSLAVLVQEDAVDILVELAGQTANNRLGLMALQPAPIQVTWIGYPNSTGLPAVDYRLTDAICDPPTTSQTFAETLIRLPDCFLAYTPSPDLPPVGSLPALTNTFITFGSFNCLAKITPEVMRLWAEILQRVPHSRLLLKNKPFACQATCHNYLSQLAAEGVDTSRVDLLPLTAGTREHLATYNEMDVSLDPFPYTGTTTTAESLVMGVPVITCTGKCHAHNVSTSLIKAVGLPCEDWVASTSREYAALAVRAATDHDRLAILRKELRRRMLASKLCDGKRFVAELEETYRSMWHMWLNDHNQQ